MSINELSAKVNELRELRRVADEISAEIEVLQDSIKLYMEANNVDIVEGDDYKITWKQIQVNRFDAVTFKKQHPDVAAIDTKTTTFRRFVFK